MEDTSQEMKEQLKVVNMSRQIVGTNSELYENGEMIRRKNKIISLCGKMCGGMWSCLVTTQR